MRRYSRAARAAAIKCIRCNAPVTETVDGEFVCVACGNEIVKARGATDAAPVVTGDGVATQRENGETEGRSDNVADGVEEPALDRPTPPNVPTTDGGVLESAGERSTPDTGSPGVGVIVQGGWSDAAVRTIARAIDRGHEVLVTYRDEPDPEFLRIASGLGATVVTPPDGRDDRSLRAALERAGTNRSLPGVVVQTEPYDRIDYVRSSAAVGGTEYVVDAVPESDPGVSVLAAIPAWNEADTIADVVETAAGYADEVVVIDDGSDDATGERAAAAGATVVRHRRNRGYGAALQTAFEEAKARSVDRLVVLDGDGQHDGDDIPVLLSALDDRDADVVIGSRFVPGSDTQLPRYRRYGISVINFLMNLSVGAIRPSAFIRDTQSGFRVYRAEVVDLLVETPGISDDMEASVDILYHVHTNGFRIDEVGTTVDYTVDRPNSRNPVLHGYGVVKTLFRTIERDHPLTTLGLPGLLSISVGLGFTISLVTATGSPSTGPFVTAMAVVLIALGIVATLAAAVLHGFNLNRDYLDR